MFQIAGLREQIRKIHLKDRALMEKGIRAYVSHIRAYSKHECSLLLRVKVNYFNFIVSGLLSESIQELPLGAVGATYSLLQLPKMPELKNRNLSDFPEIPDLDLNSIPYKIRFR